MDEVAEAPLLVDEPLDLEFPAPKFETISLEEFVTVAPTKLLRTAYLMTGNLVAAEDLAQAALERILVAWRRIKGDPFGYAHRVVVNLALNERRFRRSHPTVPLETVADPKDLGSGRDHAGRIAEQRTLISALQQLAPRQRAVVVLRFYEDCSEAEVARLLGIAPGTVKSQTSKALSRLRDLLADDEKETS